MSTQSANELTQNRVVAAPLAAIFTMPVKAEETLRFRYVAHRIAVAPAQEIGDVDAHTMAIFRNSGLASFSDQSVATLSWIGTNDYVKGVGSFVAYFNLTFSDASVLWYKGTGSAELDGTKPVFTGRSVFWAVREDLTVRKAMAP